MIVDLKFSKKFKPSYDFMLPQATIFCILYIIIFEIASWYMYVPNHEKKVLNL
jgi:hypothetical protein